MNLYLLNFNNYYNKIVRKYDTLEAYLNNFTYSRALDVNFNPNDNVGTSIILNWNEEFDPDYLIAHDPLNGTFSRWFVIDMRRERLGQYSFRLRRDLLADFYEEITGSDCFIEKGYVPVSNNLIYNSEGSNVNQIKKKEYLLKDKTQVGWLVGYLASNLAETEDKTITLSYPQEDVPDIEEFEYSDYVNQTLRGLINKENSFFRTRLPKQALQAGAYFYFDGSIRGGAFTEPNATIYINNMNISELISANPTFNFSIFNSALANHIGDSVFLEILSLKDKVYNDNGVYKKVVIESLNTEQRFDSWLSLTDYPNIQQEIVTQLEAVGCELGDTTTSVNIGIEYDSFRLKLVEVGAPFTNASMTFKATNRQLYDAPYKMFCIPVSNDIVLQVGTNTININKEKSLQIATSIGAQLKSGAEGFVYDIQLLPYCPMSEQFSYNEGVLAYLNNLNEDIDYSVMKDSDENVVGYVFYAPRSNFTFNISDFPSDLLPQLTNDPIEFKVRNETTMTRLCAPNYSKQENFNVYMNRGVNWFNIDCTYKPYTPYIKVNINYKNLYGGDYNDSRGLIVQGDFSVPLISDAWTNYQIQNKNYAEIFDREQQHLEFQHGWNLASTITGGLIGSAGAGLIGGKLLGKKGAIGGAIGGAITGATDIAANIALHGEQMDYRRDMYNFNLQNIQALPKGLSSPSAFNYNSKIFPFVEVYDCTEEEKEMVRNKIIYSGMTLGIIGKIRNYISATRETYIQARIIRIENLNEDTHIVSEINKELNGGVYYE